MWDSSREGSCRQMTTSRRKDRRPLTAKELEIFYKEMEKFCKNYKSPFGSESGQPSLIIFVSFFQALCHFLPVLPESHQYIFSSICCKYVCFLAILAILWLYYTSFKVV